MILKLSNSELTALSKTGLKWLSILFKVYGSRHDNSGGFTYHLNLDRSLNDLSMISDLIDHNTPDRAGDILYDYLRLKALRDNKDPLEIVERLEESGHSWAIEIGRGLRYVHPDLESPDN